MAKYLRYSGEFLSRASVVWRVDIQQEAEQAFASIGQLTFEADQPLVIEWKQTDKEEVFCGSTAEIRIESPGDRTYEDLYTIEAGRIRMDVYRDGALYWSGALDPEFYEEPYERADKYPVSLTFSDFGILGRLKYNLGGMQTLYAILTNALSRSTINYTSVDQSLISSFLGDAKLTLGSLRVRSENFYDEDGDALTLKEAVEGILQPLALRIVQRNGRIWVYDLNGLFSLAEQTQVRWSGDRQTMGADKVANNIKITWNTYAQAGNLAPTDCWTEQTDPNAININSLEVYPHAGDPQYISFHYSTDLHNWIDATDAGFTLWLSQKGKNISIGENSLAKFYKIVGQNDGAESEGVAVFYVSCKGYAVGGDKNGEVNISYRGNLETNLKGTLASCGKKLFKSSEITLPPVDNANGLLLRVGLNALIDCRFNPYEQAAVLFKGSKGGLFSPGFPGVEQDKWEKDWKGYGTFVYVPVTIKFKPEGSETIYVWDNRDVVARDVSDNPVTTLSQTYGTWKVYHATDDENPPIWGYLCWYNPDDRLDDTGVIGWKKNHPAINPHNHNVTTILRKAEDGQYIPFPSSTRGGRIWIEVRSGWQISDDGNNLSNTEVQNVGGLWDKLWWALFQPPELEIMNRQQFDAAISTDDVEYQAEINGAAKESIELDTICGTHVDGVPTARGAYFNAANGQQLRELTRAGRTSQVEELLIGTIYSQYAQRHTILFGEADLSAGGLKAFTEQNQQNKVFLMQGEVMDVIADVSNVVLAELRPDEYDKNQD